MLLTSGSTGGRRLITHPLPILEYHARALEDALGLDGDDTILSWTPLHHTMGLGNGFLLPLMWGRRLVRMPGDLWTSQPGLLFRELSGEKATVSYMPNFAFSYCTQNVSVAQLGGIDLSHVRALVSSGEPVGGTISRVFREKFAPLGLRATAVLSAYGMSEAAGCITQVRPGRTPRLLLADKTEIETNGRYVPARADGNSVSFMSSGPLLPGTSLLVEGADAPGQAGELLMSNPSTAEMTGVAAERFVTIDGRVYLRTGDLGLVVDGEVFVIGRADDMIKCSGQLVDPGDIEAFVRSSFQGEVAEAVAVGITTADRGTQRLAVLVEPVHFDEAGRDALAGRIAEAVWNGIGLVVARVEVVAPGQLVRTVTGKKSRKLSKQKLLPETAS
jgi:acyl-CoA synthetase (AMP-forming)/AMP-acid ligase II